MNICRKLLAVLLILWASQPVAQTVRYDLFVTDTIVNFTGKDKKAIAINGTIPGPVLEFTEGDTAEIMLHNNLKNEETSFHWHGVHLPNEADGVPYLTTERISPGESHLYRFAVIQNGTYWYHSHTALQEQSGMYGALIFRKRGDGSTFEPQSTASSELHAEGSLKEEIVVISEWTDERPTQLQRRLRTANDWYSIKKGSTQSYAEAIKDGHFITKFINEWKRMKAMDVSDAWYNEFLINGRQETYAPKYKAGDKVKLRIINAGASTYFWLHYSGSKITVTGNDGNDVEPVEVDRLIIAPAETYDVVVTVPDDMSYEFRATAEDRSGNASIWLGDGMKMPVTPLERLLYFEGMKMMNDMMTVKGEMKDIGMNMGLQKMDMNEVMYPEMDKKDTEAEPDHSDHSGHSSHAMKTKEEGIITLNYDMLKAPSSTVLPEGNTRTLNFTLSGNMIRYVWTINNRTVNEWDKILIQKGENLRIILKNESMMRHPMHLHGHDFRVVNSAGEKSPLKNVIDIMPMETDTIEFHANQFGDWFFHCHILFHMMAGMGNVFTYANSPPNPQLPDSSMAYRMFKRDNNMMHLMARISIESNGTEGEAELSSNRGALKAEWHTGFKNGQAAEAGIIYGRYLGNMQWWFPYAGIDYHKKGNDHISEGPDDNNLFGQPSNKSDRQAIVAGIQYTTPWLMLADLRIDSEGRLRFELGREDIPLTPRLRMNFSGNTDKEYTVGLSYILSKWFSLSTHYDSDIGAGAGVTITY
jgi:FtsP/CotA-like multicopper oxidase with cupredoxin domain